MNPFRKTVRVRRPAMPSPWATWATGILALLLFGAAGAPSASARQSGRGGAARAQNVQQLLEMRANKHAKNLGLTPEQTKQLVKINADALQQLDALRASPTTNRVQAARTLKSILDTRKAALGKLFTPDQMKKYTATNQTDAASLVTMEMGRALALTDEQMRSAEKINLAYIQKVSAALNLSDASETLPTLKAAQKEIDSALQKILTPEQWKQYQAHMAAGGEQQAR